MKTRLPTLATAMIGLVGTAATVYYVALVRTLLARRRLTATARDTDPGRVRGGREVKLAARWARIGAVRGGCLSTGLAGSMCGPAPCFVERRYTSNGPSSRTAFRRRCPRQQRTPCVHSVCACCSCARRRGNALCLQPYVPKVKQKWTLETSIFQPRVQYVRPSSRACLSQRSR